jgi:hypothetical protein
MGNSKSFFEIVVRFYESINVLGRAESGLPQHMRGTIH